MTHIRGRTVLITGGASGIGLLVGRRVLSHHAGHLVIWDVDKAALDQAMVELGREGGRVSAVHVDITDPQQVRQALRAIEAGGHSIDILVNNAAIVVGRPFVDHSSSDITQTMHVNAVAPMLLTRELLPGMIARGGGHIVNIASAAGMVSNPRMSVYASSKWAMIGWSDSLRLELEASTSGVRVTTVAPYYVHTGMFAGVRSPVIPILAPERVAEAIVSAITRDRIFVRLPWVVNLLPLVRGLLPARWFDVVVGKWLGVYRSMDHFKGRG
jgi:all-trans-retinol dehydrogenase (NAD+)